MLKEAEIIGRYLKKKNYSADLLLGIGDDAALITPSRDQTLAITMDTLVAGIHFPLNAKPYDIGYRSLAVNLSDLAAMGAKARWFLLALTLPHAKENWLAEFTQGLNVLSHRYAIDLIGGNLSRGPLAITICAYGVLPKKNKGLRRDQAKANDLIYTTGTLGDAGLALQYLKGIRKIDLRYRTYLHGRFYHPVPRLDCALIARKWAHACIDISDGLTQDLNHILEQSGVGAEIQLESLPLSSALRASCSVKESLKLALTAGDDYELCLTVPLKYKLAFEVAVNKICPVTAIGQITQQKGLRLFLKGKRVLFKSSGYQHF